MSSNDKTHGDGLAALLCRLGTYTGLYIPVTVINVKVALLCQNPWRKILEPE